MNSPDLAELPDAQAPLVALIEALPAPVPYSELGKVLTHLPLKGIQWQALPPAHREPLLAFASEQYVPFRNLYDPASGLQTLLRRSLVMMNPLISANRVRIVRQAMCNDAQQLMQSAALDGAGGIWKGMTGTCKSRLFSRLLQVLVPDQVIDHSPSEACGWTRLRQVVYLIVDHPSNGTRGGLCKRVLQMVDNVASTDYFDQHKRTTNLDTLLVTVCHVLLIHRVALLVIDENQEKTVAESPWYIEFVLFYLLLMNLGISVLLVGNPLAFEHLHEYSQVMRRFSVGGIHTFVVAASRDEAWWKEDFTPRMRRFSVVNKVDIDPAERAELEFNMTGGLPGLYPLLHCETQRIALRHADGLAILTKKDFEEAANSPGYANALKIAHCVQPGSLNDAVHFVDVPHAPIGRSSDSKADDTSRASAGTLPVSTAPSDPDAFQVIKKFLTRYRSQQTRATNQLLKRLQALRALSPKEREMLGVNEDLLNGLEEARNAGELNEVSRQRRKPRSAQQRTA